MAQAPDLPNNNNNNNNSSLLDEVKVNPYIEDNNYNDVDSTGAQNGDDLDGLLANNLGSDVPHHAMIADREQNPGPPPTGLTAERLQEFNQEIPQQNMLGILSQPGQTNNNPIFDFLGSANYEPPKIMIDQLVSMGFDRYNIYIIYI